MDTDAPPQDPQPTRKLIRTLDEFRSYARWHSGWTLLNEANPGLAFAVALLLPWRTEGYMELYEDLDRCLAASQTELLRQTGLPPGEQTLRILERFDQRAWWCSLGEADETDELRTALHILGSLLKFEPEAARFWFSREQLNPDDVVDLAVGIRMEDNLEFNSWILSVFFRGEHIQKAEWFFRLPLARRCSLARTFWKLHGIHVGDFITEMVERGAFPRRPHMDLFRDEAHAMAYAIRLRKGRERLRYRCFEQARLLPWPKHVLPGSGTIVPVRSLSDAYPESCDCEFGLFDPKDTLLIPLGRICLYRMLRPFPALVVLEYPHDPAKGRAIPGWEFRSLIVRGTQPEAQINAAKAHVERWLARQPEELRQRAAVSHFAKEAMEWAPRI
jgi:hypothetical protein